MLLHIKQKISFSDQKLYCFPYSPKQPTTYPNTKNAASIKNMGL